MSYLFPTLRVLLIEDNPQDAELILRELRRANGWEIEMKRIETEREFREALHHHSWDAIICDFSLPSTTATRCLQIMSDFGVDLPFILVSGTINEDDWEKVMSMRGVHEYVSKDRLYRLAPVFHREMTLANGYNVMLKSWARALELRDKETQGHSERVAELTVRLARELGVSETDIIHIRRGALIHDVGKMGVPDHILHKNGKLSSEEFDEMKKHPKLGYDLLADVPYLRRSLDIPYCHHERWDGSGYPRGLKGYEIPFPARLFAVVDVFDAMTSDRPYRKAFSKEFALTYINEQSGKIFDPTVVRVFLSMFPSEDAVSTGI